MAKFTAKCPECDVEIELEDPVEKEIIECGECGAELEVDKIEGKEVQLVVAETEGEDWGE
ncbi:MAG: hypothetical protein ACTSSJ_06645 [Candidatus Odinarchaeia archaeon]